MKNIYETQRREPYDLNLDRYSNVLRNPNFVLSGDRTQQPHLPLQISMERAAIHVLSHTDTHIDQTPAAVITNTGSFGYNGLGFLYPDQDRVLAAGIRHEQVAFAPIMLAFSKPGDLFIHETDQPERSHVIFDQIADSYAEIGVDVSRNFIQVPDINGWVNRHKTDYPIIPYALDPLLLHAFGRNEAEKNQLFEAGLINAAAYTKTGATQYWKSRGVPVPESRYINLAEENSSDATERVREAFYGFDELVVNNGSGAGGMGIHFPKNQHSSVMETLEQMPEIEIVQVQGRLPDVTTPCMIANITDEGVNPLQVSTQRFSQPGVHTGNEWVNITDPAILRSRFPPDFFEVNEQALTALHDAGVRGQVNVDSLVIGKALAERFNTGHTTLMREANIRPATSSSLIRMREGNISGEPIQRIHTSAKLRIPYPVFADARFLEKLNTFTDADTHIVVNNYDIYDGQISLAYLGTEAANEERLNRLEEQTIQLLTSAAT